MKVYFKCTNPICEAEGVTIIAKDLYYNLVCGLCNGGVVKIIKRVVESTKVFTKVRGRIW